MVKGKLFIFKGILSDKVIATNRGVISKGNNFFASDISEPILPLIPNVR